MSKTMDSSSESQQEPDKTLHQAELREHHATSASVVSGGDELTPLTPSRMSQRQAKERDKEREKEAGLQTPNREHVASPATLSPGVSYTHDE